MPYISAVSRDIDPEIDALIAKLKDRTGGALNYALSRLAGAYVQEAHAQEAEANAYIEEAWRSSLSLDQVEEKGEAARDDARRRSVGYETRARVNGHVQAFAREFERRVLDNHEIRKLYSDQAPDVPEYLSLDPTGRFG